MLLDMGKGFLAGDGVLGQDITQLVMKACQNRVCLTVCLCLRIYDE
jgi:hypothetical protein